MSTSISDLRNKAYSYLKDALIEGLQKGEISVEESEHSVQEIERNIDGLESFTELLLFLQSLSGKYSAYKKPYILFKQEEANQKDSVKMEAIQEKLRQFAAMKN